VSSQTADIIIIGGGITGCCLAYELAKRKFSVLVLEKDTVGAASSGRSGGGVRRQNRVPQELPLAMLAVKVWQEMGETFERDMEYRQNGNLRLVTTEDELRHYKKEVAREQQDGLEVHFLDEKEVRDLLPVLSSDAKLFGGTYCPGDGAANPLLVTKTIAHEARKMGAAIHERQSVTHIEAGKPGEATTTFNIRTAKGSYESAMAINAAGAWSSEICTMAGVSMPPFQVKRSHMMVTKSVPPVITPFVSHSLGYMRQTVTGNLHLGFSSRPVSGYDVSTDVAIFERAAYYLTLFPFMAHLPVIRSWAGLTYFSPDGFPIIGRSPERENFFMVAGYCGHGFCLGPGVARVLSQVVAGEKPEVDLSDFSWNRFSESSP